MSKQGFSKAIGKSFLVSDGAVTFDDGVTYNDKEVSALRGYDDKTLFCVHELKLIFGGEVRRGT